MQSDPRRRGRRLGGELALHDRGLRRGPAQGSPSAGGGNLKLVVATPLGAVVDADDVRHVRAEDPTGAFGILPGHADFLTALVLSVVTWRDAAGQEHHVAVHGGMLAVRGGRAVTIASREAVADDDLHRLETEVLARFRSQLAEEQAARKDAQRLYLAAIRQICYLSRSDRVGKGPASRGFAVPKEPRE